MLAAAVVDVHALLQMIYVSLAAAVGICFVYAVAVVAISRSQEERRAGRRPAALVHGALAVIGVAACGWAIYTGLAIMVSAK